VAAHYTHECLRRACAHTAMQLVFLSRTTTAPSLHSFGPSRLAAVEFNFQHGEPWGQRGSRHFGLSQIMLSRQRGIGINLIQLASNGVAAGCSWFGLQNIQEAYNYCLILSANRHALLYVCFWIWLKPASSRYSSSYTAGSIKSNKETT